MKSVSDKRDFQPVVVPFGRHRSAEEARKRLSELRGMLGERFPEALGLRGGERMKTGFRPVDEAGGLPWAAVSEIVVSAPCCGGQFLVRALLQTARKSSQYLALVDGSDGFDPQSEKEELLPHLLWVRCRRAGEALQAVDLLVRDGNIGLVLLDLRGNCPVDLRRQPPGIWFRLQRMVRKTGGILVVLSVRPVVNSSVLRVELGGERGQVSAGG